MFFLSVYKIGSKTKCFNVSGKQLHVYTYLEQNKFTSMWISKNYPFNLGRRFYCYKALASVVISAAYEKCHQKRTVRRILQKVGMPPNCICEQVGQTKLKQS